LPPPHSSSEPDLLVKAKVPLCLSCHDPGKGSFKKAQEITPWKDPPARGATTRTPPPRKCS